nr:putative ribonuclease H-like domain-containing protein [Tanacetum cinerariifolium]
MEAEDVQEDAQNEEVEVSEPRSQAHPSPPPVVVGPSDEGPPPGWDSGYYLNPDKFHDMQELIIDNTDIKMDTWKTKDLRPDGIPNVSPDLIQQLPDQAHSQDKTFKNNIINQMVNTVRDYEEIDGGYVAFGGNPKGGKITRKDDYSRFTWVFFLATKDETSSILKSFITRTEYLVNHKVKMIICDNGTELTNKEMNQFCKMKGIMRQFSVARTPQQNEVSKGGIGSGLGWIFDIDALTRTMNYEPIVVGTQSNGFTDLKSSHDDGFKPSSVDGKKVNEDPSKECECNDQEKEDNVNNTNNVNIVSSTIDAAGTNKDNELPFDPNMPALENVSIFNFSNDDEAYASFKDFVVYQMDVKSAFLYEKFEEEVYVCQPPGFEDPNFPDRVYKVKKTIYRLHQAPRAWYETLSTYLLDNGFQRGKIDKSLFIRRHKGNILLVQVYVDDIIFGSTKKELCNAFERLMHEKF